MWASGWGVCRSILPTAWWWGRRPPPFGIRPGLFLLRTCVRMSGVWAQQLTHLALTCVHSEASLSPPPTSAKRKNGRGNNRGKAPSPGGVKSVTFPTLASRRESRPAGATLSSWESSLTEGAHRRFHPHSFPTLLHIALLCGFQVLPLQKGWYAYVTAPALVRRDLVCCFGQRGSGRGVSRKKLIVPNYWPLACTQYIYFAQP